MIERAGRPIAKIIPWPDSGSERRLGEDRGQVLIAADFDAPLPDDVLADFER